MNGKWKTLAPDIKILMVPGAGEYDTKNVAIMILSTKEVSQEYHRDRKAFHNKYKTFSKPVEKVGESYMLKDGKFFPKGPKFKAEVNRKKAWKVIVILDDGLG